LAANPNFAGSGAAIPAEADGAGDGNGEGEGVGLDAAAVGAVTDAEALANAVGAADAAALGGSVAEGTAAIGDAFSVLPVGPGFGPAGDVYAARPTPASSATSPSVAAAMSTRARGRRIRPAPLPGQPAAPAGDRGEEQQRSEECQRGAGDELVAR
jgi:hypothetical protein